MVRRSLRHSLLLLLLQCVLLAVATASPGFRVATPESRSFAVDAVATRERTLETFSSPGATFLTVHFSYFSLGGGDKVLVRSRDGATQFEYSGLGRGDQGDKPDGFFSSRVPGDALVVEFVPSPSTPAGASFGFAIDAITRTARGGSTATICGSDDTRPAKCFASTATATDRVYASSRAVARLLIKGQLSCTGWLVGSEGHLLTNYHCLGEPGQAASVDVELGAESASCADECRTKGGCPGVVVASTTTVVASDAALDYALVRLNTTADLSAWGFLRLRVAGAVVNETMYLPQHPRGFAKRIAAVVDDGSAARIEKVDGSSACGDHRIAYSADTDGGSSGSPVLAARDHAVVALHSCGVVSLPCENSGTDIRAVIWDLQQKRAVPRDALDDPTAPVPVGPWTPGVTAAPTPPPTPVPTQSVCRIFRQQSTCEKTIPGRCVWANGVCVPNPNATPAPAPTTPAPTTPTPTTPAPTTPAPTTPEPTTPEPTTPEPTTPTPTTPTPTTPTPTTPAPTTPAPTTPEPTTPEPTTPTPTTPTPATPPPTLLVPASSSPAPAPSPPSWCRVFWTRTGCELLSFGRCSWAQSRCVSLLPPRPTPTPAPAPAPGPTTTRPSPAICRWLQGSLRDWCEKYLAGNQL
ncbi:hypothetical protein PINS_up013583 [Pythium insidiosum]|nr:hypothetical protein PINS_up013583 [Pythium insidiosum]